MLATLLLHPNRFVSTELLADALWEGRPPASATANIRTYVRSLRSALPAPIETSAAGYSIEVGTDELDASVFESLLAEAGHLRAAGDEQTALRLYGEAHALWRGRPLEDLSPASAWEGSLARLEAQFRGVTDALLELRLGHGDHAGAAVLLTDRLAEDPYDEQLWARLVDALTTAGRPAEARSAYRRALRTLADELGVEPGSELAAAGDRAARPRRPVRRTVPAGAPDPGIMPVVPSQLPLDIADFSGREDYLDRLRDLVCGRDPVRPPVAVIAGPPGTGKTALAVRLGHLVRDSFPDGQLYLDMRGATEPRDPAGALFDLLRGLDVPESAVPSDPERRSAALRSELASRRVLIVLDDVATASQVLPLLPGTGASALVITSRRMLTELTGADCVRLDVLGSEDAAALLRRFAGAGRDDAPAVAEVVEACGNLPLAIRIAGGRLVQRPDLTVADLARRLRDETHRLDELTLGELAVRTSADLSYLSLGPDEVRMYRVIGHLAVGDFSARVLDVVAGRAVTDRALDRLIEANLVQISTRDTAGRSRYRMHDLLRLHAIQAGDEVERKQAMDDLGLVLDAILQRCLQAFEMLPFEYFGIPDGHRPVPLDPALTAAAAVEYFDTERGSFVQTVRAAAHAGLHEHAWRIASAWGLYLDMRAGYDEWEESHLVGLASARACGNTLGQGIMLRNLGQLGIYRDDFVMAAQVLSEAAEIFAAIGDRVGAGVTGVGLGTLAREHGDWDGALELFTGALTDFVAAGDVNGEAVARAAAANVLRRQGELGSAVEHLATAYRLARRLGDPHREAKVRRRIAELRGQQQHHEQAVRQLRTALDILERLDDEHCASYTRAALGRALLALGEQAAARRMLLESMRIGQRLGDRSVEAQAATELGELYARGGQPDAARRYLSRAVRLWQQLAKDAEADAARTALQSLS